MYIYYTTIFISGVCPPVISVCSLVISVCMPLNTPPNISHLLGKETTWAHLVQLHNDHEATGKKRMQDPNMYEAGRTLRQVSLRDVLKQASTFFNASSSMGACSDMSLEEVISPGKPGLSDVARPNAPVSSVPGWFVFVLFVFLFFVFCCVVFVLFVFLCLSLFVLLVYLASCFSPFTPARTAAHVLWM